MSNNKDSLTTEEFVHAYMNAYKHGNNQNGLAYDIGVSRQSVNNRIKRLLDAGVKLPPLIRKELRPKIDVPKINSLIEQRLKEDKS